MASRGKSERLQYQLLFKADKKKFKTKDEAEYAIAKARKRFIDTGAETPGIKIIGRWRNPDNNNPVHADWKTTEDEGQSLYDFWKTLGKGRGALR